MCIKLDFSKSAKIDFSIPSNNRNIYIDEYKVYVNNKRMVNGNFKLKRILVFDMPAVTTCLNSSKCQLSCYALKAQVQYPLTQLMRDTNLWLFENKPQLLKDLIKDQIRKSSYPTVRLHSSGDFLSQDYIDFWTEIVAEFPNKNFYAYTKVDKMLNFDTIETLPNFNLISSFIEGRLNYGSMDYIMRMAEKYNSFICPATISSDVKCGKDCNYCVTQKNVVFKIH